MKRHTIVLTTFLILTTFLTVFSSTSSADWFEGWNNNSSGNSQSSVNGESTTTGNGSATGTGNTGINGHGSGEGNADAEMELQIGFKAKGKSDMQSDMAGQGQGNYTGGASGDGASTVNTNANGSSNTQGNNNNTFPTNIMPTANWNNWIPNANNLGSQGFPIMPTHQIPTMGQQYIPMNTATAQMPQVIPQTMPTQAAVNNTSSYPTFEQMQALMAQQQKQQQEFLQRLMATQAQITTQQTNIKPQETQEKVATPLAK